MLHVVLYVMLYVCHAICHVICQVMCNAICHIPCTMSSHMTWHVIFYVTCNVILADPIACNKRTGPRGLCFIWWCRIFGSVCRWLHLLCYATRSWTKSPNYTWTNRTTRWYPWCFKQFHWHFIMLIHISDTIECEFELDFCSWHVEGEPETYTWRRYTSDQLDGLGAPGNQHCHWI